MAFPVTTPVLSLTQSINAITEAEAGIAQCLADFLCNEIFPAIDAVTDVSEQTELTNRILCSYTCKEKAMAGLIDSISNLVLADKGLVPGGDDNNANTCGC